jgi:hypothetical protein
LGQVSFTNNVPFSKGNPVGVLVCPDYIGDLNSNKNVSPQASKGGVIPVILGLHRALGETFFRAAPHFPKALGAAIGDLIHLSSDPPCLDALRLLKVVIL